MCSEEINFTIMSFQCIYRLSGALNLVLIYIKRLYVLWPIRIYPFSFHYIMLTPHSFSLVVENTFRYGNKHTSLFRYRFFVTCNVVVNVIFRVSSDLSGDTNENHLLGSWTIMQHLSEMNMLDINVQPPNSINIKATRHVRALCFVLSSQNVIVFLCPWRIFLLI